MKENPWFSDVFRGYRKRAVAWNGLKESFVSSKKTKSFISLQGSIIKNVYSWYYEIKRKYCDIKQIVLYLVKKVINP